MARMWIQRGMKNRGPKGCTVIIIIILIIITSMDLPLIWLNVPEFACNAGDPSSVPGLGRSPGEGNDNPLQYSCLENPMDEVAWQAIVHGV